MLVSNWMSKDVISVDVNDSMQDAAKLIRKHKINRLPVMENGKLVGIVTDRDLKRASASDVTTLEIHELLFLISEIKIRDIMTKDPITIPIDYTIDEAAQVLLEHKLSGAPVVDHEGQIAGVITQTDIFRVLVLFTGVKRAGIQFAFQLEDRPGSIKEVSDIMRNYGCLLVSILSGQDVQAGYRRVYIRVRDCDKERLEELKERLRAKANVLYVMDPAKRRK
jgi:acetoin utilization protein AcuB